MSTISSNSKVVYMYDEVSDTWYAVAGVANTNVPYSWTQAHTFGAIVTVNDVIRAKAGINRFQNPASRDAVITSPQAGIVCFVAQTDGGTDINELQYYVDGSWKGITDTAIFSNKVANHTLVISDPGKTITVDSSSDITITVPPNSDVAFAIGHRLDIVRLGAGNVTVAQGSGVTINSKNSNKKIAARYSGATLIKYDTNTWILIGDLTA